MQKWLPVLNFEGLYEISDQADVRSVRRGIVLRQYRERKGYRSVSLYRNGRKSTRRVHVLMAEVFLGPRPAGLEVCHGPAGVDDNTPGNLRWDTSKSNSGDIDRTYRTYCRRGVHELTPDNTYVYSHGGRICKACARDTRRRREGRL